MKITVVCSHCHDHNNDPSMEINFKEGCIHYMCPECRKESSVSLKVELKPYPKSRRMN